MFNNMKRFDSSEGCVWKYVFEGDKVVAEAVLYKYQDFYKRTVICCSTQSGCPVGCTFCGTGKQFIRNLTPLEIVQQVVDTLTDQGIDDVNHRGERFQIMFMSMGEPMLNWDNVEGAIRQLHDLYPNAELLISTIGIDNDETFGRIIKLSQEIDKLGLQFSIHEAYDEYRDVLIPFKNKMTLRKIRDAGLMWSRATGRPTYLNYCVQGGNTLQKDLNRLKDLFSPIYFYFTFSVVCSADESMKDVGYRDHPLLRMVAESFTKDGYNTRTFDPAGQDDIGGGCGQLWYVQEWMKNNLKK